MSPEASWPEHSAVGLWDAAGPLSGCWGSRRDILCLHHTHMHITGDWLGSLLLLLRKPEQAYCSNARAQVLQQIPVSRDILQEMVRAHRLLILLFLRSDCRGHRRALCKAIWSPTEVSCLCWHDYLWKHSLFKPYGPREAPTPWKEPWELAAETNFERRCQKIWLNLGKLSCSYSPFAWKRMSWDKAVQKAESNSTGWTIQRWRSEVLWIVWAEIDMGDCKCSSQSLHAIMAL